MTLEQIGQWVKPRVTEKRYKHICGVTEVAERIAQACDEDVFLAKLCGLLHDACKEIKGKELVRMAHEFGMSLHPVEETHGHLIHGPIGAKVARAELGITNQLVLDAIAEHTLGKVGMTTLSKVVFLADGLEEGRPASYTAPIWQALDIDGKINLDKAIAVTCDLNLRFLLDDGKPIHPLTVDVRNYYWELVQKTNNRQPL